MAAKPLDRISLARAGSQSKLSASTRELHGRSLSGCALGDTGISGREHRPRTLGGLAGHPDGEKRRTLAARLESEERRRQAYLRQETQPAYVQACFANPFRRRTYWVYTWKPGEPASKQRSPYHCGSWRCEHCQQHAGHVLWSRLQEAFKPLEPSGVVFVVLTLDPKEHVRSRSNLEEVYKEFAQRQNRWMKRLRRYLIDRFGEDFGNRWASVTEAHRTGVPHVNIAIYHPAWAAELRRDQDAMAQAGANQRESILLRTTLLQHAKDCGFGWASTCEANRTDSTEAICGYLVKCVKHADEMHGEMAKLTQLPLESPKNFRRLRAGKRFVPPPHKGSKTGTVIRRYYTPEGDEQTEPLSQAKMPEPTVELLEMLAQAPEAPETQAAWSEFHAELERKAQYIEEVEECIALEQRIAWREEGRERERTVKREELIATYHRRWTDGAVLDPHGNIILPPRAGPPATRPESEPEAQPSLEPGVYQVPLEQVS